MPDLKQLPSIAEAQRSPLVEQLLVQLEHVLEENRRQAEIIQQMRDEIAVLKGQKAKPKFRGPDFAEFTLTPISTPGANSCAEKRFPSR